MSTPLLVNVGYADLFCFSEALASTDVSTRSDPVGGRVNWNPLPVDGVASVGVGASAASRLAIRASNETDASFGSLFVLMERARPSDERGGGGAASPPVPDGGSSVCIKQHLLPYGHEPDTQNVCKETFNKRSHTHNEILPYRSPSCTGG